MEKLPTTLPGKKPLVLYAIQRKSDNLYSKGGCGPSWGRIPKTWGLAPFKNHLNIFCVDPYRITLHPSYDLKNYYAEESWFTKDYLIRKTFPYWDCEVLEIRPDDLIIINRFDAVEWAWHNAFKPYYENSSNRRYLENIKEFAAKYGIKY